MIALVSAAGVALGALAWTALMVLALATLKPHERLSHVRISVWAVLLPTAGGLLGWTIATVLS